MHMKAPPAAGGGSSSAFIRNASEESRRTSIPPPVASISMLKQKNHAQSPSSSRISASLSTSRRAIASSRGSPSPSSSKQKPALEAERDGSCEDGDDISALAIPKELVPNRNHPATTTTTTIKSSQVRRMKAQLWDAHRLCSVVLGERISTFQKDDSTTFLRAIRSVAELHEELNHAHTCLALCRKREQRHRQNFVTKQELLTKVQALEFELKQQSAQFQTLRDKHDVYVHSTKSQLQELYCASSSSSSSSSSHDPDRFARLFAQIAAASVRQQVEAVNVELAMSQKQVQHLQSQQSSLKEKLSYEHHVSQLDAALHRAQRILQRQQGSSDPQHRLYKDLSKARADLEALSDNDCEGDGDVSSSSPKQLYATILDLLERTLRSPAGLSSSLQNNDDSNNNDQVVMELKQSLQDALKREDSLNQQATQLAQELTVAEDEQRQLYARLDGLDKDHQATVTSLQESLSAKDSELQDLEEQLLQLIESFVEAEENEQTKSKELEQKLDRSLQVQKAGHERIVSLKQELQMLQSHNAELHKTNRDLLKSNTHSTQEVQDLHQQLEALTEQVVELQELQTKYAALHLKYDTDIQTYEEDQKIRQQRIDALEKELQEVHSRQKDAQDKEQATQEDLERLQEQVATLTTNLNKADESKKELVQLCDNYSMEMTKLQSNNDEERIQSLEAQLSQLQVRCSDLESTKQAVEEAHALSLQEIVSLKEQLTQAFAITKSKSFSNLSDRSSSTGEDEHNILDDEMLQYAGIAKNSAEESDSEEVSSLWVLQQALSSDRKLQHAQDALLKSQERIQELEAQLQQIQDVKTKGHVPAEQDTLSIVVESNQSARNKTAKDAPASLVPSSPQKSKPSQYYCESPARSSASTTSTASTSTAWFSLDSQSLASSSASTLPRRNTSSFGPIKVKKLDP